MQKHSLDSGQLHGGVQHSGRSVGGVALGTIRSISDEQDGVQVVWGVSKGQEGCVAAGLMKRPRADSTDTPPRFVDR